MIKNIKCNLIENKHLFICFEREKKKNKTNLFDKIILPTKTPNFNYIKKKKHFFSFFKIYYKLKNRKLFFQTKSILQNAYIIYYHY